MCFVLVHSPLVGPGTWKPVAHELERRGQAAVIPSLVGVAHAPTPQWRHCPKAVAAATEHVVGALVLVAHSGAGPLLPTIAAALSSDIAALIFVDAFLPPTTGSVPLATPPFMAQLRALAKEDVLPPWSAWFGEQGLRELVPDARLRTALEQEMPRLPLAYFAASVPVPAGWDRWPCGYLLFASEPYGDSAAEARRRGWPVVELSDAHHLALVADPLTVTDALLRIKRALVKPEPARPSAAAEP